MNRTHSVANGADLTAAGAVWSKSSYSDGAGNNCLEVADLTPTAHAAIALRDSKHPQGPALLVSRAAFAAFTAHVSDRRHAAS